MFNKKSEYLKAYPWSSFAGYCYLRKRNKTIDYGWLLSSYYGEDSAKGRRRYRQYVYDAIGAEIENPFEEVVHQSVLGTEDFVACLKQKLPKKGQREIPSLKKLHRHISVENIIGQVAKVGNAAGEDLRDRKTPHKVLRQIAMELSYRCSNCKQKEIGAIFGVDYSTVSQSRARLRATLKSSRKFVTGLSATVTRKDGHHPIIFMNCGPVRYKVDDKKQAAKNYVVLDVPILARMYARRIKGYRSICYEIEDDQSRCEATNLFCF